MKSLPPKQAVQLVVALFLAVVLGIGCAATLSHNADSPESESVLKVIKKPDYLVRFIAFGDSGSGIKAQYRLGELMAELHDEAPFGIALMLGDNIYENGNIVKYADTRFIGPYKKLLDKNVRFYPALGNHDVVGPYEDDQIRFFKMPGRYYDYVLGNVHFYVLDTNEFNAKQQAWLEARLVGTREPWKIVYGHHPIYSSGEHGNSNALIKSLKPVLEKYDVDLYLAGHDHNYERFAPINGVQYIVSGGAGAYLRKFDEIRPGSVVRKSAHHFISLVVADNVLQAKVIGENGGVIDQWTQTTEQEAKLDPAA